MRKVHPTMIQSMFSSTLFERGFSYYEQNRVTDLTYDKAHHIWTSQVHGRKTYFVEINYRHLDDGRLKVYCDCPAFATYSGCKHIVATILNVNDHIDSIKDISNYDLTNHFINALTSPNHKEQVNVLTDKVPMKVEYECHIDHYGTLKIELKTGVDHCYVVRDVNALLTNVLSNEHFYFTKRFSFDPDIHYFLQKDVDIFKVLHSMLMNEEVYSVENDYYTNTNRKRTVTIAPLIAHNLLEKLIERHCTIRVNGSEYTELQIVEHELPFNFTVQHGNDNDYLLHIDQLINTTYLDMYQLLFSDGTFYFPTDEQLQIVEQMFHIGLRHEQLPVSKEQSDIFFSETVPLLKKVGPVNIDHDVMDEIVDVPLKAECHLHLDEHFLSGQLKYMYGSYEIDPFSQEERDIVIVRDTEKEREIMSLIEQAQFHYNGKDLYINSSDEELLYNFLYTFMPLLEEKVDLYITDDIKRLMIHDEFTPEVDVKIEATTNLLEVGFSIDGVSEEEVNSILQAVIEKRRYYRMKSGALISLENDDFSSMKQFFTQFDMSQSDLTNNQVTLPAYRTTQIDELFDVKKNYHPSFQKLLSQLNSPNLHGYDIPESLNAELRDYQKVGFQWLKTLSTYHLGGILADDMGLGKTIQTIAFILSEQRSHPHLIVVPASVVYNWRNEFRKFAPSLTVDVIAGLPEERLNKINDSKDVDVLITSYGTIRQDINHYDDIMFQTLILDEAQYIKNYATKTSQAVRQIKSSRRFALSGTPIENSLDELWAIFQVILPGLMPSQRVFRQLDSKKITSLTRPFILRRLKEDVLSELPEKIESVHVSQLTQEQKALYIGYLQKIQAEATQSIEQSGFQANRMKILAGLTRLRQLCCHPSLFIENYDGKSGKLEQLMEMVHNLKESGKRMLIFSQFTSMHELIREQLQKLGIDYFYLHGETKLEERVKMAERFNDGEKDVFLISLRAGGTGLNLTGADTVILYDLWWNPAVEDQAAGRAHRFGQKNVVQVIRFITEGTIEEKIYELQQKKRELIDEVIQTGDSALSSLTEDDIRELLSL